MDSKLPLDADYTIVDSVGLNDGKRLYLLRNKDNLYVTLKDFETYFYVGKARKKNLYRLISYGTNAATNIYLVNGYEHFFKSENKGASWTEQEILNNGN